MVPFRLCMTKFKIAVRHSYGKHTIWSFFSPKCLEKRYVNKVLQVGTERDFIFTWLDIRREQPTRCDVSQFIYFYKTLYMFQTVFPSIIRSSKLLAWPGQASSR